jgi:hypothetical protein
MKHTSRTMLAALLLVGGAISYFLLHMLFRSGRALPRLPWTTAPLLLFVATALFLTAFNVNRRLEERREAANKKMPVQHKELDPLFLARLVLLAKSAAHGGALLSGIYAGVCVTFLVDLPHSNLIWNPVLDTASAVLVAISGYILERVLSIKDDGKAS